MRIARWLLAACGVTAASAASAQAWPTRPVKVVVAFAAGSATDIIARVMSERFARTMGQPFVVENKPGAGGSLGTEQVRNAAPDGYTLVAAGSGPFGVNPAIYSKLPYDPVKDFELIGNIVLTPQALVAGAQAPYAGLRELAAAARSKPGEIAYASLGTGSTSHLSMEAFLSAAGLKMNHVPFKGSSEAHTQIIGGNVPVMFDTVPGVLAHAKSGKLRVLGVATLQRSPYLPEAPTIAEQGYAGFESVGWIGLAAPARTPGPILDRLNAEIRAMLQDPAVKARIDQLAFTPVGDSREAFTGFVKSEIARWSKVAKDSGARAD